MMRKTIVRTMATSEIRAFRLSMIDGKPEVETLEPIRVMGKVNDKEALKVVKEAYGDLVGVTIGEVVVDEATYEISVSDFMKYAKKVEPKAEELEEVESK